MRFRTFIYLLLGFLVAGVALYGFYTNRTILDAPFILHGTHSLPIGIVIVIAGGAGFALAIFVGLMREGKFIADRWRRKREEKRMMAIEERYYEGVQAVVEGREEDALRNFRKILEQEPNHFNALLKAGEVQVAKGKYAEGIDYHQRARQARPEDTRPLYALANDYAIQGDLDKAKAILQRMIEIRPRHAVSAYRRLRELFMREGDWARALEVHNRIERLTEKGVAQSPKDERTGIGIRYQLAMKQLTEDKPKVALNLFQRILKEHPKFIPAYIRVGEIMREIGDDQEAAAVWNRGYDETGSPIFLTILEEHFLDREQPIEAIEALKACVARASNDILPRFFLGKLFFRLEMLDEAHATLKTLEGRASYAPTLHYLLGRINERRGNFRQASEEFRKVIKHLELVKLEYRCHSCQQRLSEWSDRCPKCEEWNSIEIDFREDLSLQELGITRAPIYSQLL
jgi:lipopolysaccharide biosynthesis regulator YciM